MKLVALDLADAYRVELEAICDERGSFARCYCAQTFSAHGLEPNFVQANVSRNLERGTLRGLHYQLAPHAEAKLMRCVRGRAHVIVLDLRSETPSAGRWVALELDGDSGAAVYVPPGCASGFQTLSPNTELHYQMSAAYVPASARGVRWDDPRFALRWPITPPPVISSRDQRWPDFQASFTPFTPEPKERRP